MSESDVWSGVCGDLDEPSNHRYGLNTREEVEKEAKPN